MLKKIRLAFSVILLLAGGGLLTWASLPAPMQTLSQTILPWEMQLPASGNTDKMTILTSRQVTLEWPKTMRAGDDETVTLVFQPVENPASSSDSTGFTDIYQKYAMMAEGRLEAAGLLVDPVDPRRESMPPGQTLRYTWHIRAVEAGTYPVTIWFSLRYLPLDGNSPSEAPILIRQVTIQAESILGISGPVGRIAGTVGIGLSIVVSIDRIGGMIIRISKKRHNGHKGRYIKTLR